MFFLLILYRVLKKRLIIIYYNVFLFLCSFKNVKYIINDIKRCYLDVFILYCCIWYCDLVDGIEKYLKISWKCLISLLIVFLKEIDRYFMLFNEMNFKVFFVFVLLKENI